MPDEGMRGMCSAFKSSDEASSGPIILDRLSAKLLFEDLR